MNFQGADTDQLRDLASRFTGGSGRLEELLAALRGVVDAVDWVGPDAEDFRLRFDDAHQRAMDTTSQLSRLGARVEQEADEQDQVSAREGDGNGIQEDFANAIHKLFGSGDGGGSSDNGSPWDRLGKALDTVRNVGLDQLQKALEERGLLGKWGKRAFGAFPIIGAAPDVQELIQAYQDGDTGGVVSNSFEVLLGVAPNPVTAAISEGNSWSSEVLPGDRTAIDYYGDLAENTRTAKNGEELGSVVSDWLGFEEGSGMSNAIKADLGAGMHIHQAMTNPAATSWELWGSAYDLWKN